MMFDVLLIGAGVSGVSCALVLGSAQKKPYCEGKKIGIITHQKASSLQNAVFNNAYGIAPGTLGSELLNTSLEHLATSYPDIQQIEGEKVLSIATEADYFVVQTNKNTYQTKILVLAIGAGNPFTISGLENYVMPHQKIPEVKNRIQLKNTDHLVTKGIYVAGVLAGHRSQLAIAAGSGAAVATDILTLWNNGNHTMVHDAL